MVHLGRLKLEFAGASAVPVIVCIAIVRKSISRRWEHGGALLGAGSAAQPAPVQPSWIAWDQLPGSLSSIGFEQFLKCSNPRLSTLKA